MRKNLLNTVLNQVIGATMGAGLLIITLGLYGVQWYAP